MKRALGEARRTGGGGSASTGAANDCGFTRAALILWFTHDRSLRCSRGLKSVSSHIRPKCELATTTTSPHPPPASQIVLPTTTEVFLITKRPVFTGAGLRAPALVILSATVVFVSSLRPQTLTRSVLLFFCLFFPSV